jgi:hypothetical protein
MSEVNGLAREKAANDPVAGVPDPCRLRSQRDSVNAF